MRHSRKCYNCGKLYEYCNNCFDDRNKPVTMSIFHDQNCADIFNTCVKFNMGLITKEEARNILTGCDMKDISLFRKDVQRDIKIITAEPEEKPAKIEFPIKKAKKIEIAE